MRWVRELLVNTCQDLAAVALEYGSGWERALVVIGLPLVRPALLVGVAAGECFGVSGRVGGGEAIGIEGIVDHGHNGPTAAAKTSRGCWSVHGVD